MKMKSPTSYFLIFSLLNPLSFHNTLSVLAGEYQAECDEQTKQEHLKKHPPLNMALKMNKGKFPRIVDFGGACGENILFLSSLFGKSG